jgi:outer membrane protein TolC
VGESLNPPPLDPERIRVAASELKHPRLRPIDLDLRGGLTPDQAAVLAVLANPDLVAVRNARGEAQAQLVSAGLLPNPTLTAEADRPHGPGSEGTVTNTVESLGFDVGALVGRSAKVAAARAELASVDLGIAWQEWQVAQSARLEALRVACLERRLALAGEEIAFEENTLGRLERALNDGDAALSDVGVQRSALEGLRQVWSDLERDAVHSREELGRMLGLPSGTRPAIVLPLGLEDAEWSELPAEDSILRGALESRLDLEALRRGYEAEEARVRQAVLAQFPALSVGIARQRDEGSLNFLGGFVSLSIPMFDRQQGAIRLEEATRDRLRHEYEARIAAIRAEIGEAREADRLYAAGLAETRATVAGLTRIEAAESAGVDRGDIDRLSYQAVRTSLFEARLRLATLAQARAETRVALEAASGAVQAGFIPGGIE